LKKQSLQHWILSVDLAWVLLSMALAYILHYGFVIYPSRADLLSSGFSLFLVSALLWVGLFSWMKLDGFRLGWYLPAVVSQLFLGTSILLGTLLAFAFLLRLYISRLAIAYFAVLLFTGLVCLRRLVNAVLRSEYLKPVKRRILIIGNGPVARELATKIERHPEMFREVVGFLCSADSSLDNRAPGIMSQTTTLQTFGVIKLLQEQRVDEVVITLSRPNTPEILNLAARCRREGIGVSVVPYPYELYISRPQLLDIGGLPVLQLNDAYANFANGALKRGLDILLSCILLPFSLVFVAVGSLLLIRKSGGPLYREPRCGRFGEPFDMYRLNSDRNSTVLPRIEVFLQQLSITELPQLWNVLRGDMSLVGPRPESPERVQHYSDWQRQRLNVRPGMTGFAQVHGLREQHSSEEKARFDLQYILHSSPVLDLSILLQTVWVLVYRLLRLPTLTFSTGDNPESTGHEFLEGTLPSAHSTQSSAD
jgi:lipopolysaccharide/colanic/teichoic acid biosynthesis glycosyltransferase